MQGILYTLWHEGLLRYAYADTPALNTDVRRCRDGDVFHPD